MLKKIFLTITLITLLGSGVAVAASLVERFASEDKLTHGALVAHEADNPNSIVPATPERINAIAGVVVNSEAPSLFQIENDGRDLDIVTNGVAELLVTDQNGAIAPGDLLSTSSIAGVASRQAGQSKIVAVAVDSFEGVGDPQALTEVYSEALQRDISVGRISVRFDIHDNPYSDQLSAQAPGFVQDIADRLAGEGSSSVRAAAAFIVVLISLSFAVGLFITLRASVVQSASRNPNSRTALLQSQRQLAVLSVVIALVGLSLAYLILSTA